MNEGWMLIYRIPLQTALTVESIKIGHCPFATFVHSILLSDTIFQDCNYIGTT